MTKILLKKGVRLISVFPFTGKKEVMKFIKLMYIIVHILAVIYLVLKKIEIFFFDVAFLVNFRLLNINFLYYCWLIVYEIKYSS